MFIDKLDLETLGFINGTLTTNYHIVTYVYYDVGRLKIISNPALDGMDYVYLEDYFEIPRFIEIIESITGHRILID